MSSGCSSSDAEVLPHLMDSDSENASCKAWNPNSLSCLSQRFYRSLVLLLFLCLYFFKTFATKQDDHLNMLLMQANVMFLAHNCRNTRLSSMEQCLLDPIFTTAFKKIPTNAFFLMHFENQQERMNIDL